MECYKSKIPKMETTSSMEPIAWKFNDLCFERTRCQITSQSSPSPGTSPMLHPTRCDPAEWPGFVAMSWRQYLTYGVSWCYVTNFFREMIEPCEERISKISSLSIQQTSVISKLWIFVVVYSWLRFLLGLFDLLVCQGSVGFPASARWNCFASIAILAWKFDSTLTTKAVPICDVSSWRCKFVTFKVY